MNNMELNALLKKTFWSDCNLVINADSSYQLEFRSKLTLGEFKEFAVDFKKLLSQYIEIGEISFSQDKLFILPINKLSEFEKGRSTKKLTAFIKAMQFPEVFNLDVVEHIKNLLDDGADVNNTAGVTSLIRVDQLRNDGVNKIFGDGADGQIKLFESSAQGVGAGTVGAAEVSSGTLANVVQFFPQMKRQESSSKQAQQAEPKLTVSNLGK
ncbi:MAG: hypothetical protein WAL30_06855 [Candidatus Aquirickettsiella sp.]